jgi:hypothetical protein
MRPFIHWATGTALQKFGKRDIAWMTDGEMDVLDSLINARQVHWQEVDICFARDRRSLKCLFQRLKLAGSSSKTDRPLAQIMEAIIDTVLNEWSESIAEYQRATQVLRQGEHHIAISSRRVSQIFEFVNYLHLCTAISGEIYTTKDFLPATVAPLFRRGGDRARG